MRAYIGATVGTTLHALRVATRDPAADPAVAIDDALAFLEAGLPP